MLQLSSSVFHMHNKNIYFPRFTDAAPDTHAHKFATTPDFCPGMQRQDQHSNKDVSSSEAR
jgi:hypothetical protein